MKYCVLGATGMAGHVIASYLKGAGHEVIGVSRRPIDYVEYELCDAMDKERLREILEQYDFDIVINCIGVLNHAVDTDLSAGIYLNSYLPHYLVDCLEGKKGRLIHISTDCVFSGKDGNYVEESTSDAYSFYGKTKALGEVKSDRHLTFRTSIIGPDKNKEGIGLFNWFVKQMGQVDGYKHAIWTGVTTITLAKAVAHASIDGLSGIYHLVNDEVINKYDMLMLFNRLRNHPIVIQEEKQTYIDKSLVNTRNDFAFTVPSYEEMIAEMGEWIKNHSDFYVHYKEKIK